MTKIAKKGEQLAYNDATPELLTKVREVLEMRSRHKLSTSRIYDVHNTIMNLTETPEACPSCLSRRADKISAWYAGYLAAQAPQGSNEAPAAAPGEAVNGEATAEGNAAAPGETKAPLGSYQRPEGSTDYPLEDGTVIVFTPGAEDENKGTVTKNDGAFVKPGTYASGDYELKVAVGGKATLTNTLV